MRKIVLLTILLLVVCSVVGLLLKKYRIEPKMENEPIEEGLIVKPIEKTDEIYPIAEFKKRVTKKYFGTYVSPQDSPVQSERFEGFHTGVDVEYEDVEEDVPVFAVCDGEIVMSRWVNGYGGTLVLKCQEEYFIYGHLNVNSIVKKTEVLKEEQIGILGKENSIETDYERKHLHFGVNKISADLRGYVQNKDELKNWLDPLEPNIW